MRRAEVVTGNGYASAAPPSPDTPWREAGFCVLDLETTGLDVRRDQIVSFAAVPVEHGRVVVGGVREGLVRPSCPMPAQAIRIHGIRAGDVAGAPALDAVLDELLGALAGRVLVAHVDWIERGFLNRALEPRGLVLHEPLLDTARLARAVFPELPEPPGLSHLARRLSLPVFAPHEALGDALTTAQVFLALATMLDRDAPQTVGSLCTAGDGRRARRVPRRRLPRLRRRP